MLIEETKHWIERPVNPGPRPACADGQVDWRVPLVHSDLAPCFSCGFFALAPVHGEERKEHTLAEQPNSCSKASIEVHARPAAATMMQAIGVSLDVIDRCQNHVMPGSKVHRHYMHHHYAEEKRDAWGKLGTRVDALLAGA